MTKEDKKEKKYIIKYENIKMDFKTVRQLCNLKHISEYKKEKKNK